MSMPTRDETNIKRRNAGPILGSLLLLVACVTVLSAQLFVRPFIGMADNGDFSKVTGRISLGPKVHVENFTYVVPVYIRSHQYRWGSEFLTSETVLAAAASSVEKLVGPANEFDIRFMGAVHGLVFFLFVAGTLALLAEYPTFLRLAIPVVALIVFTDVLYVAYYNSFYSDTIAFLSLLWMVLLALAAAARYGAWYPIGFTVAAVFFVSSKAQHALAAWIPAVFLVWVGWKERSRVWSFAAALVVSIGVLEIASTPTWVKGMTAFDVVFHQIAIDRRTGVSDLRDLGLDSTYDPYLRMYAYEANSPALSQSWSQQFSRLVPYRTIAWFYIRHPVRTLEIMHKNIRENAIILRPIGNFCVGDGRPRRAITHRFAAWSDFKAGILRSWPDALIWWYAGFVLAAGMVLFKAKKIIRRDAAGVALGLGMLGIQEFAVATLADAVETPRHLFLFQACTDLMICFAVVSSIGWISTWFVIAEERRASGDQRS